MSESDYQYKLLEMAYEHQRAFRTVDPRYKTYASRLIERGYIEFLDPKKFTSMGLSIWESSWAPMQKGYRLFKRWERLRERSRD